MGCGVGVTVGVGVGDAPGVGVGVATGVGVGEAPGVGVGVGVTAGKPQWATNVVAQKADKASAVQASCTAAHKLNN